jgi:hydroxymethylpyrimidine/phosphomethylpyrimidine kinase
VVESADDIRTTIIYKPSTSPPVALTIAGSDSSAGAGIQADLKTFNVLNVYGLSAVTCVVAEIPGKVSQIAAVEPEIVREQIEVLAKNFPVTAMKTGLLCSAAIISAVARAIVDFRLQVPLVVDPVITATGGDPLLKHHAIEIYEKELFPLASLITPNLDEAARLLDREITSRKTMEQAGKELKSRFSGAILLKGGHLPGVHAVDLLFVDDRVVEFSAPFVRGVFTHGTGCTYSAAITAGLAKKFSLADAIGTAKDFVTGAIRNHYRWGDIHALKH